MSLEAWNFSFSTTDIANTTDDSWPYDCVYTSAKDNQLQFIPIIVWIISCILTIILLPIIYRYLCCCAYNNPTINDKDRNKFEQYSLFNSNSVISENPNTKLSKPWYKRINIGNTFDVILKSISISGMISTVCGSILLLHYYDPCTYQRKPSEQTNGNAQGIGFSFWQFYLFGILAYLFIWYLELHFKLRTYNLVERLIWYTVKTIYLLLNGACFLQTIYLGNSVKNSNVIQTDCICLGDQNAFIVIVYNFAVMFAMLFLALIKWCCGYANLLCLGCWSSIWIIFAVVALYYRFVIFAKKVHDFDKFIHQLSAIDLGDIIFIWFMVMAFLFVVKECYLSCKYKTENNEENDATVNGYVKMDELQIND